MKDEILATIFVTAFVIIDYGTGVAAAVKRGDLQSLKMRNGLWHKLSYYIILTVAATIESASRVLELGFPIQIYNLICVGIALIEITSIVENCIDLNPNLRGSKIANIFHIKTHDRKDD